MRQYYLTYKIVANKLEKAEKELAKFNKKMNPGPPEPSKGFSATGALQRKKTAAKSKNFPNCRKNSETFQNMST